MSLFRVFIKTDEIIAVDDDKKVAYKGSAYSRMVTETQYQELDDTWGFLGHADVVNNWLDYPFLNPEKLQTLFFAIETEEDVKTYLKEKFKDYLQGETLVFPNGDRVPVDITDCLFSQLDGVYAFIVMGKLVQEGMISLTDGSEQITHINQITDPMGAKLKAIPDVLEQFGVNQTELFGQAISYRKPKLTI